MFKDSTLKQHLVSAGYSFLTGFIPVILLSLENLSWTDLSVASLSGIFIAAIRAGLKALVQFVIPKLREWVTTLKARIK